VAATVRSSGSSACATLDLVPDAVTSPQAGRAAPAAVPDALASSDLVAWGGGHLLRDSGRPIRGAAVDSRLVRPDELFVALAGERTDGHRFLTEAVAAGAAGLLVAREPAPAILEAIGDVTVVVVSDPLAALQAIAAGWRARFSPLVVGVTGSIAKTSTKEAVATVLAAHGRTLRSEGNQNNEIGLPLTLMRLTRDDVHAVLEMGMYTRGEIAHLCELARPSIGVVTAVQGVHLSRVGTIDVVADAKAELLEALPREGTAILNADDSRVRRMATRTPARIITYGFAPDADVRAVAVRSLGADGMAFTAVAGPATGAPGSAEIRIPVLGRLSVHNALAGIAVGLAVGMHLDLIAESLTAGWAAPHRGQLERAGGVTIVDDSYNASPASMIAALELLAGLDGRRVAVLGEMLELGDGSHEGHLEVGRAAAATCSLLVTVGSGAAAIAAGAREAGMAEGDIVEAADRDGALVALRERLASGDAVLVKASRGAALDLLVADLLRTLA
jgi:UDP-N-acetylmuramoyl-tripeptide--D-alanyl-D-alanine ligase